MASATKSKPESKPAPAVATFAEINARKVRERIEAYRDIVQRRATGAAVTVDDMERAAELLEQLGLPQYTFDRDCDAVVRFKAAADKAQAAADAAPEHRQRAEDLAVEVEAARRLLDSLREQHRQAVAKASKAVNYSHSVLTLQNDHPHVLGSIDEAVRLRIDELDRRRGALEVVRT